ncbi:MAG: tetrahydrofolate dehydrogenase/cyclohydrolase catalytic domain-containing protein, partial [Candidatus Binatia bacterium]
MLWRESLYKNFYFCIQNLISRVNVVGIIIDGKAVAREIQKQVKEETEGLKRRWGVVPGLGVVLVGDDPASHLYVKNKG